MCTILQAYNEYHRYKRWVKTGKNIKGCIGPRNNYQILSKLNFDMQKWVSKTMAILILQFMIANYNAHLFRIL